MKKSSLSICLILSTVAFASPVDDARALREKGLYQPAIDILEKEVRREPLDSATIKEYAKALFGAAQWEKSIPWLEKAVVADPEYASLWRLYKAVIFRFLRRRK